ncbi:hypothetical protein Hanom_Chr05g00392291 [Helianthus anomalus]
MNYTNIKYIFLTLLKVLDFGKGVTTTLKECMKNDFREEACLWQKLKHPNVTKVYLI